MYLLDTTVVSEMKRISAGYGNAQVAHWLGQVEDSAVYLSAITVVDLELGCLLMERQAAAQGIILRQWLSGFLARYQDRIIAIDGEVARRAAVLQALRPRACSEALTAATAITHRYAMVTRNTTNFLMDGLQVINPWIVGNV